LYHDTFLAVHYHDQSPVFNEEVRLELPHGPLLDEHCHLCFQFRHISLASAFAPAHQKSSQKSGLNLLWILDN
jgi:hypothetical protein